MNYLDLFSGVGGFHKGLTDAGFKFDWVGFSEIDKYATSIYKKHFSGGIELGSVESINSRNLPNIDIITFGYPCQDNSIAGKRRGQKRGTRSGLLFTVAKLIAELKPRIIIAENVKGLSSVNGGTDFIETIWKGIGF